MKISLTVYMKSERKGYDAIGLFDGKGILILANSKVATVNCDSLRHGSAEGRKNYVRPDGLVGEDQYFKSPSGAACFVCGRSANGYIEWKTSDGVTLKEYLEHSSDATDAHSLGEVRKSTVGQPRSVSMSFQP